MANNPRLKTHPAKSELSQVTPDAEQDDAAALASPGDSPLKRKLLTLIANFYAFLSALKELYAKNRALGQQQAVLTKALEAKMQLASSKKQPTSVVGNSLQLDELSKLRKKLAEVEEAIRNNKDVIDHLTQRLALLTANQPELQQVLQTVASDITTVLEEDSHATAKLLATAGITNKLQNVLHRHEIYMPELPELMQQQLRAKGSATTNDFNQQVEEIVSASRAAATEVNPDEADSESYTEHDATADIIDETATTASDNFDTTENQAPVNKELYSERILERTRDPLRKFIDLSLAQRRLSTLELLEAVLNIHPHLLSNPGKIVVVKNDMMSVLLADKGMRALEQKSAAKLTEKLQPKVSISITVDYAEIRGLESQLLVARAVQDGLLKQQSDLAALLRPGASRHSINAAVQTPTLRFDRTSKQ